MRARHLLRYHLIYVTWINLAIADPEPLKKKLYIFERITYKSHFYVFVLKKL